MDNVFAAQLEDPSVSDVKKSKLVRKASGIVTTCVSNRRLELFKDLAKSRLQAAEREDLIGTLSNGQETRVTILYKLVRDPRFAAAEKSRLTVLLYYFGYLQRNPDDPPDRNLDGFNFWVHQLESNYDVRKLDDAFKSSGEYMKLKDQR